MRSVSSGWGTYSQRTGPMRRHTARFLFTEGTSHGGDRPSIVSVRTEMPRLSQIPANHRATRMDGEQPAERGGYAQRAETACLHLLTGFWGRVASGRYSPTYPGAQYDGEIICVRCRRTFVARGAGGHGPCKLMFWGVPVVLGIFCVV